MIEIKNTPAAETEAAEKITKGTWLEPSAVLEIERAHGGANLLNWSAYLRQLVLADLERIRAAR